MRAIWGLLGIALASGAAQGAHAAGDEAALTALNRAAFAKPASDKARPHHQEARLRQGDGAVSPITSSQAPLAADQLFSNRTWALSGGTASWRSQSLSRARGNAVDTVRLTVGAAAGAP